MLVASLIEAVGVVAVVHFAHDPVLFVFLTGLVSFAWCEICGLFLAACSDRFGTRCAGANHGLLHTAEGTASPLVPLSGTV